MSKRWPQTFPQLCVKRWLIYIIYTGVYIYIYKIYTHVLRIISDSCVTIFVSTPLRVEHSCKDNCAQAHCPSRGSASSETFFSIAPSSNRSYRICEAPLGATTNPRRFRLAPLMRQDVGEICSQFRSKRHLPFTSSLLKAVGWLVLDPYGRTKPLLPIGLFAKKLAIHVWISCQLVHWIVAHQYSK